VVTTQAQPISPFAYLSEHGVKSTLAKMRERAQSRLYLEESHVWSALDLTATRQPRPLREGLRLVQGGYDDIEAATRLPEAVAPAEAARRLDRGARVWLVREGDAVAFVCWIFTGSTPVIAAPRGSYDLPGDAAMLEDSVANPDYRGQGVAPATWTALADILQAEGYSRLLTKVEVENAPSRKAVSKAGFVEGAVVHLRRAWLRNQVRVESLTGDAFAREIRARTA
jgi:RimJ/RimL family protein N-acetyltransferase